MMDLSFSAVLKKAWLKYVASMEKVEPVRNWSVIISPSDCSQEGSGI